jgi:hypothetical protein
MKLAIMQPYLFPYIGYFHLIVAVDKFVFYDDVDYIKGGWINRNRVLLNGKPHMITLDLKQSSSFKRICETELDQVRYIIWRKKTIRLLEQAYAKAPYLNEGMGLVRSVLDGNYSNIAEIAKKSIQEVLNYLSLEPEIVSSSRIYSNNHLKGKHRVIDICQMEKASIYINAYGGRELYDKEEFESDHINLQFIQPELKEYPQQKTDRFVPGLSIIDVIMNNNGAEIRNLLKKYTLE